MRANRGTLTEPGKNSPFRDRSVEENLDLFRRMRAGEFPERRARAARQDRHGVGQHQPARPGALPHPACAASAHRRRLVDLSELRLRARPVGRDRGHHAFDLHARVRGSPAALRLVPREPAGAVAAAPVRVRAAQPHLHGAVEARAHRAGARRPRHRLGRSAHADARRPAPARRAAGGDPRFRQARSASPRPTAWSTSRMFELAIREVLNRPRRAAWRCCGRSRS